nr:uncharacterized protein LOC127326832 [Lolium perenne]
MVAGRGSEHGRTKLLSGVIKPQRTLTQIRSTLTAGDPPIAPPRHRRTDANFGAAYAATYEKYLTVVADWDLKRAAWEEYQEATSRALRTFFQTGERIALPEEEPPRPGPTPLCPSREAFAATYYARTPGTGSSRNRPSPGSSREGTPMHPGRHSPGASGFTPDGDGSGHGSTSVYLDKGRTPEFTSQELGWSWRAAVISSRHAAPPALPWLISPSYNDDDGKTKRLFCPEDGKVVRITLPSKAFGRFFMGAQDSGWVATLGPNLRFAVVNLFSGIEVALSEKQRRAVCACHDALCIIQKVVFSEPPTSSGCILAAITHQCGIALCRIGCPEGG